jgi:hypothetical protein
MVLSRPERNGGDANQNNVMPEQINNFIYANPENRLVLDFGDINLEAATNGGMMSGSATLPPRPNSQLSRLEQNKPLIQFDGVLILHLFRTSSPDSNKSSSVGLFNKMRRSFISGSTLTRARRKSASSSVATLEEDYYGTITAATTHQRPDLSANGGRSSVSPCPSTATTTSSTRLITKPTVAPPPPPVASSRVSVAEPVPMITSPKRELPLYPPPPPPVRTTPVRRSKTEEQIASPPLVVSNEAPNVSNGAAMVSNGASKVSNGGGGSNGHVTRGSVVGVDTVESNGHKRDNGDEVKTKSAAAAGTGDAVGDLEDVKIDLDTKKSVSVTIMFLYYFA